jgi:ribonuclease HI
MTSLNTTSIIVHTDGGARGNPGPAAIGVVVYDHNRQPLLEHGAVIGSTTNNEAEYQALLFALRWLQQQDLTQVKSLTFNLDSELVIKQINGEYRVKHPNLLALYYEALSLIKSLAVKPKFSHVRRVENSTADALVNQALDSALIS